MAPAKAIDRNGFTLVEFLVVVAMISILSAILLPALSRGRDRARGIVCLDNTRQLDLAWQLYADDHNGSLPYNRPMTAHGPRTPLNWVNNVLTWGLDSDNTNIQTILQAGLGTYISTAVAIYHCPSDKAVSPKQAIAGWTGRIRSYSMNAMVGNAGDLSESGFNVNNPNYTQFFKLTQIPRPAEIFVFLDEHPDSINDGYFLERDDYAEWHDLPASYHDAGTAFSFADGHSALHRWTQPTTVRPPAPLTANLPISIPSTGKQDLEWVLDHMSVDQK